MRIFITGASGFLGGVVTEALLSAGHEVTALSRQPRGANNKLRWVVGTASDVEKWQEHINRADAVIYLAGESVAGRWTKARREAILSSRRDITIALCQAMQAAARRPNIFISASAVGYYAPHPDNELDETAPRGSGFLADVTYAWETAAKSAVAFGCRVAILRFSMILDPSGGPLPKLQQMAKLGLLGTIGSGRQYWPWISRHDAARMVLWALNTEVASGTFNGVSPNPMRQSDFVKTLATAWGRSIQLPAPAFGIRLALGDMGSEMLLASQRVVPRRTELAGFKFDHPTLKNFIEKP